MKINNLYKEILQEAIDRNKIFSAIQNKRTLTIYYKADREENEVTGWRKIEPFCAGINKYGNPVLRAWQTSGVSNTYPPGKEDDVLTHVPGWRMFRMDKIVSMAIGWDKFTSPRPKYNPDDKDMDTIFAYADFGGAKPNPSKLTTPITPSPTTGTQPQAPVAPAPVAPKATPQPVQKPVTQPKSNVIPQVSHPGGAKKDSSFMDKLTDKFKRLINYKPKK